MIDQKLDTVNDIGCSKGEAMVGDLRTEVKTGVKDAHSRVDKVNTFNKVVAGIGALVAGWLSL